MFSFSRYKYYCKTLFFKLENTLFVASIVRGFSYFGFLLNYFDLLKN
jgi:hypothetical protein